MTAPAPSSGAPTARRLLASFAALAMLSLLTACEFRPAAASHDTPPQSWWDQRGPVVPHDTFPTDCSECHLGEGWETIREDFTFDHEDETGVRLDGAHARAECLLCHNDVAPVAVVASRGCRGCHEDPHRRMLGVQCQTCHTEDTWSVKGDIGLHNRTRFPLVGAHAATTCFRCHEGAEVGNFSQLDVDCISCHQSDLNAATDPDHVAQGWVNDCDDCHIPTQWSGGAFLHDQFPLLGVHAATDCEACHVGQQFGGQPKHCAGCHMDDFVATTDPDHQAAGFPQDCDVCHDNFSFENSQFDHAHFPLTGSHAAVDCQDCHQDSVFAGTPANCAGCHIDEYNQTTDPNHAASGYSTTCEQCHMPTSWEDATFDHQFFPLTGAHMGVDCEACHVGGDFETTSSDCSSCHQAEYDQTTDPDHSAAGFPPLCDQCHTPTTWESGNFDHSWYPLLGQHQAADCASCHQGGIFEGTPNDCVDCHLQEYSQTSDPDHQAAGFPTSCQVCHTPIGWEDGGFDHSHFPLTGAHLAPDCADCHIGGVYEGTPNDCVGCHLDEYTSTNDPDHAAAGFPTDCQVCHTPTVWDNATFDHSQFPLTGAHAGADCASCHVGGVFQGTPNDCASCHIAEYNAATDPDHATAGFPTDCQQCHTPTTWDGANFDHTWFPLEGAHAATDCASCHEGGVFQGTPNDCASCHIDQYNATTNPNHQDAGFPTSCQNCHEPFTWTPADFDHAQFPLTGAHNGVSCEDCHVGGVFGGTSSECSACHLDEYDATTDPDHQDAGFPTDCNACHTPTTWFGATFDHSSWPLTGQHQGASCTDCHQNGVYEGTPTNCVSCHLSDYNNTNNPNHSSAGFPTSCQTCHDTNGWDGADFDHDFPLQGPHNVDCNRCHTNPGNYGQFTCLECHAHNKNDMDDEHDDVGGYSYNSNACLNCHPNGND